MLVPPKKSCEGYPWRCIKICQYFVMLLGGPPVERLADSVKSFTEIFQLPPSLPHKWVLSECGMSETLVNKARSEGLEPPTL